MDVYGLRDTWDLFMSDDDKEHELNMSQSEAETMDSFHDGFDDYDANTAT